MDWLQSWDPDTVASNRTRGRQRLEHTGSDQFPERRIEPGDRIFVCYVGRGDPDPKDHLFLLGRLVAESPGKLGFPVDGRGWLTMAEARKHFGTTDIWDARAHVVARARSASWVRFGLEVPPPLLPRLVFLVGHPPRWKYTRLALRPDRTLIGQTVRRVRRLDPDSAASLESLLDT